MSLRVAMASSKATNNAMTTTKLTTTAATITATSNKVGHARRTVAYNNPPVAMGNSTKAKNVTIKMTIPMTVVTNASFKKVGNYAFKGCTGLTNVILSNSLTYIGKGAFRGCTGLTNITIPNSVRIIKDYAFKGCTGLNSIVCKSKNPPISGSEGAGPIYIINDIAPPTTTIYVPKKSIQAYKTDYGWRNFKNIKAIESLNKK